jgi:NTP pyrophosphatase (non-canonical NTP hydrolase)
MHFNDYQKEALKTAVYPVVGRGYVYPALGLAGETGEVLEKVKKVFRDGHGKLSPEARQALIQELGDVLWYLSALSHELGVDLNIVAELNLKKLAGRKDRNKIHGVGDMR